MNVNEVRRFEYIEDLMKCMDDTSSKCQHYRTDLYSDFVQLARYTEKNETPKRYAWLVRKTGTCLVNIDSPFFSEYLNACITNFRDMEQYLITYNPDCRFCYTIKRKPNISTHAHIARNSVHIKVDGHVGTWYVIDTAFDAQNSRNIFLLEHEEYGDEASCIIVDSAGDVLLDDVWNGFDDYIEEFEPTALYGC